MYSEGSCSFSGNNTVDCFTKALMEGIILKDKPSTFRGVCAFARSVEYKHSLQKNDMLESREYSADKECVEILRDDVKTNTMCTCDSNSGKRHCYENEIQETGSRTRKFFRMFGHFRSFEWRLVLFSFILLFHGIGCSMSNNILQLNIPTEEPVLDPNTVCKTFPELSPKQYRLCAKYPDVTASAIQGIQIAVYECQFQLKGHRWNCSSLEKKNKNPHSSPMLSKGYKESAFAYAISAAGVTHQVAKACSMGKLKSCGCDMSMQGEVKEKFEWGGCSHNVEFGIKYAKRFTNARENARDIHARINLHNNRAGRLAILHNVKKQCKCHGMSGSCEIKTCWKVAPDFRKVGDILKKRFHKAAKVNLNNYADSRSKRRVIRKQPRKRLLFYEKSPNFCDPNPKVDSPGTTGRFCNKTSKGTDNCETLCCGRGYNTLRVKRSERCNCKFHWCCYVVCQTCTYNEWVTVCK